MLHDHHHALHIICKLTSETQVCAPSISCMFCFSYEFMGMQDWQGRLNSKDLLNLSVDILGAIFLKLWQPSTDKSLGENSTGDEPNIFAGVRTEGPSCLHAWQLPPLPCHDAKTEGEEANWMKFTFWTGGIMRTEDNEVMPTMGILASRTWLSRTTLSLAGTMHLKGDWTTGRPWGIDSMQPPRSFKDDEPPISKLEATSLRGRTLPMGKWFWNAEPVSKPELGKKSAASVPTHLFTAPKQVPISLLLESHGISQMHESSLTQAFTFLPMSSKQNKSPASSSSSSSSSSLSPKRVPSSRPRPSKATSAHCSVQRPSAGSSLSSELHRGSSDLSRENSLPTGIQPDSPSSSSQSSSPWFIIESPL